ncbi:putative protease [Aristaeella lactis]|uniref:Protease n=2 Tax=Aristaeella lactis TaxID=3046383 RepID=A0AC61PNV0_9FIRM|nr:putative protease [Aristaeella lactis]
MENLAPAGNRAALERADAAGADAVYLGYAAFSARAGAGNFDRQELEDAIRYAHLRHMRVHVTVNTLVKDGELEAVTEVLRLLRDLHADAVLIQDLGVLRIARNCFPELTVHASTQMAIHNRTGVLWCKKQGIHRVVLARECSLSEIRKCADTGVETEVFAHGAQCVAVSGLCLFSSMVGERSGNRGRCAQPCRMEYNYRGRRGAWLSPRDVCLRDELPKLQEAGVASIKLEGRLKRPEYVAVVAGSYRKGLDSLERGSFEKADRKEKEGLLQIFNRGSFMNGYALGCEDAGVIFPEGVNHQGIRMGRITAADGKLAHVKLEKDLQNGDGLALRGEHEETGLVYSGPDMKAGETAIIRLRPGAKAAVGDSVYRLTAVNQLKTAESMKGRTVPVDLFLKAMPGEALKLTATDGESTVTVTGEIVAEAKTRAATEEELCRNLEKTGETVFEARAVKAKTAGAFVPVSLVNAIRREALGALTAERISAFETRNAELRIKNSELKSVPEYLPNAAIPNLAYIRNRDQAEAARAAGLRVVWCPEDYRTEALEKLKAEMQPGDWLAMPDVCEEDTLQMLRQYTEENKELLGGVVLGSVGQLGGEWPVAFAAGPAIPVMNRQAASMLMEEGCAFVTASPELTGQELKTLLADGAPIVTTVYGRTRLMLLHHCPARTALGLAKGHAGCRMCDEGHPDALAGQVLEDRKGYRFPLLRQRLPEGCLVQLMNALPTDNIVNSELRIQNSELKERGLLPKAIILTTENEEESKEVVNAFREGRKTAGETTSGHWKRAVE